MANINTLLKELGVPKKWKKIESPTMYNGEIIPFGHNPPVQGGYFENGNIITKNRDGSFNWLNMTIYDGEQVKCFEARFAANGKYKNLDIKYFGLGEEKNVVDNLYMSKAIKETIQYIRKNKDRFRVHE